MEIASLRGVGTGSEWGWIAKLYLKGDQSAPINAFYNELVLAVANGGTISYDVIITPESITVGGGSQPSYANVNFFCDNQKSGGFDQEGGAASYGSATFPIATTSTQHVVIDVQTSGPKVADDGLAHFLGFTDSMQVGLGSSFNNADGFKYYIDNFSVTAIPEPTSVMLAGLASLTILVRRRR